MKLRKIAITLLAILMMALAFASCGGGTPSDVSTQTPNNNANIANTGNNGKTPQTGDDSHQLLYLGLVFVSVFGLVVFSKMYAEEKRKTRK